MMAIHDAERGAVSGQSTNSGLISRACLVGATLGSAEVAWVLAHLRSVPAIDVALLFLYGCAGYALAAATAWVTTAWLRARHDVTTATARLAVAVAIATVLSVYCLAALLRLRQPQLAWLGPGCVLPGAVGGLLAWWISARIGALRSVTTWCALNAVALGLGLAAVALHHGDMRTRWYAAAVAALAVVGLAIVLLRRRRHNRLRTAAACNAILYVAVAAMPAALSGLDRLSPLATRSTRTPPNILLISVDTLRSDRLGCYGYARARTPNIDALAKDSVLFEQATTSLSVTGPAHTTMLTGLYPVHHGATFNGIRIRDDVVTVPEVLSHRGYGTAAFVSGWPMKDAATGLASRFDYYDEDFAPSRLLPDVLLRLKLPRLVADTWLFLTGHSPERLERRGGPTTDRVLAWLSRHRDRPVFVLAHYYDPHAPYAPPPPYDTLHDPDYRGDLHEFRFIQPVSEWQRLLSTPRDLEHVKALYDGEISYTDAEIGRLLNGLATLGLAQNTVVILTADHGESLTEHNFYFDHAEFLYETDVHVPLMIRIPGQRDAGTRWPGQVRLVDLGPTMLELAGARPAHMEFDGASVLPILNGAEAAGQRVGYGAIHAGEGEDKRSRYSVRDNGYKLIWNFDRREWLSSEPAMEELYDLTADPGETRNLIPHAPATAEQLRALMTVWIREKPQKAAAASESVKERLRALGY